MYAKYTVHDVLEVASVLEENLSVSFLEAKERYEVLKSHYLSTVGQSFKEDLGLLPVKNLIQDNYQKQHNFIASIGDEQEKTETFKTKVSEQQKYVKSQKESQCSDLEKQVADLQNMVQNKNKVLAYKILTKTSFVYSTRKVKGVIAKKKPEYFNFDPKKLSQEEISERLWALILS